jgi:hypothetical protein
MEAQSTWTTLRLSLSGLILGFGADESVTELMEKADATSANANIIKFIEASAKKSAKLRFSARAPQT